MDTSALRTTNLTTAAPVVVLLGIATIAAYRLLFHPLAKYPGPFWAKITGEWLNHKLRQGLWDEDLLELHKKYGRIVRISPHELSLVDEHAMKNLYGHRHNAIKTTWYDSWDPPSNTVDALFTERDKATHAFLRKRVSAAYSMSSILGYETLIQSCFDLLVAKLGKYADAGQAVNMSDWTNALAFDVVGELSFGGKLGHLETETDVDGVRSTVYGMFKLMALLGHYPGQFALVANPVVAGVGKLFGVPDVMTNFFKYIESQVQYRLDNWDAVGRTDLLTHFCQMKKRDGSPADFPEIVIEAVNTLGAGADTTSIGMRNILYYLAKDPKSYRRLQEEVDAAHARRESSEPLSYNETRDLPFLTAVVKEATRLRPSIVYTLPRYVPPEFSIRGQHIPAGTRVGISPAAQNRDRDIWGEDADEFRPDRFLDDDLEKVRYLEGCLMTFGGNGPRMCVGKNIALVEMHKFAAQMIRNFDFEFVDIEKPWKVQTFWFAYQKEMHMKMRKRVL